MGFYKIGCEIHPPGEGKTKKERYLIQGESIVYAIERAYKYLAKSGQFEAINIAKTRYMAMISLDYTHLTAEELAGAVAWKQGFIYIMIYPPYDKLHYSRKPYKGVKIVKGVRSAYDTIVRMGGRIPANLEYDMGIMDVFIGTPARGKPELKFRRDVKQKTKHSGLKVAKL